MFDAICLIPKSFVKLANNRILHGQKLLPNLIFELGQIQKSKTLKKMGMVRDALGSVGGSSLSIFTGFSKNVEKLKIRKFKIGRDPSEMRSKYVYVRFHNLNCDETRVSICHNT